jgi:hypothetical protein
MRSPHDQLPAVEMIRGPSTLDFDAPAEVTSPRLCDPPGESDWTTHCFELIQEPHGPPTLSTPFIDKHRAVFAPGKFVIDQFEPDGVFRVDADLPVGRLTHRDRW